MQIIRVHNRPFRPYINAAEIAIRVAEMGRQISVDYAGKDPLFLGILNGSFIFAADLFRSVDIPAEISFIKLASYKGTTSTGNVITAIGLEENLRGRHVIIVEDIVDTGKTMSHFIPELQQRGPASVKIACFLSKPDAMKYNITPDYTGFVIPDNFVVGYGLDYDGYGRNFKDLYVLADQ